MRLADALTVPHAIVLVPGSPAWWAAYAAIDQYAENTADLTATFEDDDVSVEASRARRELADALALLDCFTGALCALAEDVTPSVRNARTVSL